MTFETKITIKSPEMFEKKIYSDKTSEAGV